MSVLRQLLKNLLLSSLPRRMLLARGPRSPRTQVALTFDDGPDPQHTPGLLERLNRAGLRATFFVIGERAARHPELIKSMVESGHEVANHTYTHSEPHQTTSQKFLDEIRRTDDLIHQLTGTVPTSVRPPKGELNWSKLRGLWKMSKTVVLWNSDPKDFRMQSGEEMAQWSSQFTARDGDIVLMHDNHPYAAHAIDKWNQLGMLSRFTTTTIQDWLKDRSQS